MKSMCSDQLLPAVQEAIQATSVQICPWSADAPASCLSGPQMRPVLENLCRGGSSYYGPTCGYFIGANHTYAMVIPLSVRQQPWGALCVFQDQPIAASQLERAQSVARLVEWGLSQAPPDATPSQSATLSDAALLEAHEAFCREVAEELHGRVQNKLLLATYALERCLESAEDGESDLRERIAQVRDTIESVREEDIRRLGHRLFPGLVRLALKPALLALVRFFSPVLTTHLVVSSQVARLDSPLGNQIGEEIRLACYRVVEEALANAVRHGRAHSATVSVSNTPGWLVLRVEDDGCGATASEPIEGIGWALMKSRVNMVGGVLDISSGSKPGLAVSARFPLPRKTSRLVRMRAAQQSFLHT